MENMCSTEEKQMCYTVCLCMHVYKEAAGIITHSPIDVGV